MTTDSVCACARSRVCVLGVFVGTIRKFFRHSVLFSYYLWSISLPGRNGAPNFDLSEDQEAQVANSSNFTAVQLTHERVITKIFSHYAIPLEITDAIRSTFKAKLWRMGKLYSKQGGKQRQKQLINWKDGKGSSWNLEISEVEVNR